MSLKSFLGVSNMQCELGALPYSSDLGVQETQRAHVQGGETVSGSFLPSTSQLLLRLGETEFQKPTPPAKGKGSEVVGSGGGEEQDRTLPRG